MWTYSDNPPGNTRDAVRFLVQDTDINRQLATDAEVSFVLAQEHNIYMAAARLAESIASRSPIIQTFGQLSVSAINSQQFMDLAKTLRQRGSTYIAPSAGGISIDDKAVLADNSDWVKPLVSKGMHDNV